MTAPQPQLFDTWRTQYLAQNPDVATSGMSALQHYKQYGKKEGRLPAMPPGTRHPRLPGLLLFAYPVYGFYSFVWATRKVTAYLKAYKSIPETVKAWYVMSPLMMAFGTFFIAVGAANESGDGGYDIPFSPFLIFVILPVVALLAFILITWWNAKNKRADFEKSQQEQFEDRQRQEQVYRSTPGYRLNAALANLDAYAQTYAGYDVQPRIELVSKDMRALMARLKERGTPQQLSITQTQYADILEKTVMCISPDYLKDILDNPNYWHHPEKRIAEVEAVLEAVPVQIVQNIQQVNSASDLEFQTALAVLGNISDSAEIAALYERNLPR